MKVCVCGKGGSGKSTLVALLAAELGSRGKHVIVVDSDESNTGLYWMLGFPEPPTPLMELAGGKKSVQRTLRAAFVADGEYQQTPVLARDTFTIDDLPPDYLRRNQRITLVCIGKIHQALEGCACPMGVLTREFLKKLHTRDEETSVVDMEAGVEHFGRGVETSVDAVVVVVEPSLDSVSLAEHVGALASGSGATFVGAVLNKVNADAVAAELDAALKRRGVSVLGTIPFRRQFVQWGLAGTAVTVGPVAAEVGALVDTLQAALGMSTTN